MSERKREIWLDALRFLAAFLVIVNHTNSGVFMASDPTHITWWGSILWYYVSKTAVPIYVMVSGACLLPKKDSLRKAAGRFVRILAVLLIFSYAYFLHDAWAHYGLWPRMANLRLFFSQVRTQQIADSFWYLYFYLGLMLMLPFLQRMCSAMTRAETSWLIAACMLFGGGWPLLVHYIPALELPGYFDVPLFSGLLGLFFAGHWLRTAKLPTKAQALGAGVIFVVTMLISGGLTCLEWMRVAPGEKYWFMDERTQPALLIMLGAMALCVLARGLLSVSPTRRAQRVWTELGGCSFGIYLLQEWLILQTKTSLYLPLQQWLPAIPAVILWELAVLVLALCAAWIMRRIPGLRSLL